MVPEEERESRAKDFLKKYKGRGKSALPVDKVFSISGLTGEGCQALTYAIFDFIVEITPEVDPDRDIRFDE
jgi:GTPase